MSLPTGAADVAIRDKLLTDPICVELDQNFNNSEQRSGVSFHHSTSGVLFV